MGLWNRQNGRFMNTSPRRAIWLLCLITFSLAACSNLAETLTEDDSDNRITVYALPSSRNERYLAAFQREHPNIEVELVEDTAAQLTNLLQLNSQLPTADVIWNLPVSNALQLEWLGLLKPYAPKNLDLVDPRFRDPANPPHWVGTAARVLVFCVNTEKTADPNLPPPTSWQALANPVYEGELTFPNPMTSGAGYLILATAFQQFGNTDGWDYLETLDNHVDRYAERAGVACQVAANGDAAVGISFDYRAVQRVEAGDPIEIIYPEDGAGWDMEVSGLVQKQFIKPAAQTFLDWTLSETAVAEYAQDREAISISYNNPDAGESPSVDPLAAINLLDADMPWIAANRERIMREWIALYGDSAQTITAESLE